MQPAHLLVLLLLITPALSADPKSHYMIHCMGCHLTDGSGMPPDVPAFDEQLSKLIRTDDGRAYLIRVPGSSQSPLSNPELAGVLNWILNEYSAETLPQDFAPFTAEEVASHRNNVLSHPQKVRAALTGMN